MISEQLYNPTFNRAFANSLTVGTGRLQHTAYRMKCKMTRLATIPGASSRQRYAAICDASDTDLVWKVPKGGVVRGVTISAPPATVAILRDLDSSIVETDIAHAGGTPCGEIALGLYRTGDDLTADAQYPIGSYIVGDNFSNERASTARVHGYSPSQNDQYQSFFKNFLVNCNGHAESLTISNDPDAGVWFTTIHYRQAVTGSVITGQVGAPVVYAAASRTLFRNMTEHAGVYIPFMTAAGLVGDGTWGMALAFVAEATFHEDTGAKHWKQLDMDVTVHVESVGV